MHVLIVDDHFSNRELCRVMLQSVASRVELYQDGLSMLEGLRQMHQVPDLILLDVMMPGKDGFAIAEEVRREFTSVYIPILFLTILDDQETFQRCLSVGDDIILKPLERNVLVAKVMAHNRIAKMHREVALQRDELQRFQEQVKYDYSIADSIFTNLIDEMSSQMEYISGLRYVSTPSTVFNGDLIVVARRPHGGVYVMIADATGHGLPAAISAIPATRAFFSMAHKGLPLGEIVAEINNALVKFLPLGMMLAASVFEVRANGVEVTWWGGGLPEAYLIDADGTIVQRLVSSHMPLGVLQPEEFEANLVNMRLEPNQQIICYTDGVTEATNDAGEQFGQLRLEQVLENSRDIIPSLYENVRQFAGKQSGDDLSILAMKFPISDGTTLASEAEPVVPSSIPYSARLLFPGDVLRETVIMNEVRHYLLSIIRGGQHLDLICSVLSELFANAIDHGLLGLESSIKEQPDGFFTYYQLREERLAILSPEAWVSLELDYCPDKRRLVMTMEQSDGGFDYQHTVGSGQYKTHGRGLVLVQELCDSIQYCNQGRSVTVVYSLNYQHPFS